MRFYEYNCMNGIKIQMDGIVSLRIFGNTNI